MNTGRRDNKDNHSDTSENELTGVPTKERLGKKTRDIDRIRRGLEELERDEIAPGEMKVNMRDRVKGNKGGDEKGDNNGNNGGYDINELGT